MSKDLLKQLFRIFRKKKGVLFNLVCVVTGFAILFGNVESRADTAGTVLMPLGNNADDTPQIQAALAALPPWNASNMVGGGVVQLGPGRFNCMGMITLKEKTTLRGVSEYATQLSKPKTFIDDALITADGSVENLCIYGWDKGRTTGHGLIVTGRTPRSFKNLRIAYHKGNGIILQDESHGSIFENIHIHENDLDGFRATTGSYTIATNGVVLKGVKSHHNGGWGIRLPDPSAVQMGPGHWQMYGICTSHNGSGGIYLGTRSNVVIAYSEAEDPAIAYGTHGKGNFVINTHNGKINGDDPNKWNATWKAEGPAAMGINQLMLHSAFFQNDPYTKGYLKIAPLGDYHWGIEQLLTDSPQTQHILTINGPTDPDNFTVEVEGSIDSEF